MYKVFRTLPVVFVLLLAACASDQTPTQEAGTLLETYLAVARPALKCVETPACEEKAGDEIRAADAVAFSYTESVTNAAIAWADAPEDQKPAKLSVFDKVLLFGQAAVEKLAHLL
jgi:hypothetical protein